MAISGFTIKVKLADVPLIMGALKLLGRVASEADKICENHPGYEPLANLRAALRALKDFTP